MTDQEPTSETAGEQQPGQQRLAAGCLAVIGVSFAGTIVMVVPETAYYTAGLLTAAGIRRARGWAAGRRLEEEPDTEPVDIVAVLQQLAADGGHVRLTQLQEAAGLPDTKAVRALLDTAGIPIRPGVRAAGKNGPGVHAADIPPLGDTPSSGCLCTSGANTNANNEAGEGPEKGFRVEAIGQGGTVVHHPAETRRHHRVA